MKTAFITGASGQDGSLLAEFLLEKGYRVFGLIRQGTQFTPDKYGHLKTALQNQNFQVRYGDITDPIRIRDIIAEIHPNEIYNLAAQSHVGLSFEQPVSTMQITGLGVLHVLDAIKHVDKNIRFYQASSSELFGRVQETPQNENTKFYPRSPYGCAKAYGHYTTVNYREAYGIYAANGILYNHEGPRRGENFVTRKITRAIGRIKANTQLELVLGNTDARRDWGYAEDYVEAMWLMLQQDVPKDYVIGTGETHAVQEFIDVAFMHAGLDPQKYVKTNPDLYRPAEVDTLCADASLAKKELGWAPKTNFSQLAKRMVDFDIALALKEKEQL